MLQLVCACLLAGISPSDIQEPAAGNTEGERWCVILVGIPGDEVHGDLFRETADTWEKWLTETLNFSADHVVRLPALTAEKDDTPAQLTANAIRTTFADLSKKLQPDDALWVFTLGHGNYDGKHAWFHVAGRDPSEADFGRWLSEVKCREQVFWLTQSNSGWFVKPLSKPGRIVIAATAADDESNETEFPHALAAIAEKSADALDSDHHGKVSIAEFYTAVIQEVSNRFKSDKRLPTEHPQLDDNGDGHGTEELMEKAGEGETPPPNEKQATARPPIDGELARKTYLPYRNIARRKAADATRE
jgi:hypothetical protein